ncbi:hypothetical protein CPB83DRAFT_838019 [Crepidotus variabilis]|uniref:Uncharacterized protein n=1 Tax=Crepidotus variabilis TaxID=179855 RepID=A0A9P6JMD4_9AGAR|nr:hypothetical protein CPB83DRAFT_838019 [Crepidotus variabilis]
MSPKASPAVRTSPQKRTSTATQDLKEQTFGAAKGLAAPKKTVGQRSKGSSAEAPTIKTRQPFRCSQCPSKPLRNQCVHTKIGRDYLNGLEIKQVYDPQLSGSGSSLAHSSLPAAFTLSGSPSSIPESTSDSPVQRRSKANQKERPRSTVANPIYGTVEGVMRGLDHDYMINSKEASQKFWNSMNGLCKEISAQTSCWLFIGAQHAAANNTPIHYSSPQPARDGGEESNVLATKFLQLIKLVESSKRTNTIQLQHSLDETQHKYAKLEAQLRAVEAQVQEQEQEQSLSAREGEILVSIQQDLSEIRLPEKKNQQMRRQKRMRIVDGAVGPTPPRQFHGEEGNVDENWVPPSGDDQSL